MNTPSELDNNHVNMWIVYAINHNARVLHLCYIEPEVDAYLDLLPCLVAYHSLEELCVTLVLRFWLEFRHKISRYSTAEFSRLKRLHFSGLVFICNDLQKFISGCLLIGDFELDRCVIRDDDSHCLYISSKTMTTLRIWDCDIESMIRFSIPSLISLHYEDSCVPQASFVKRSSLVHAFICGMNYSGGVDDLMYGVSNVKILKLFDMQLEFINDKEVPNLPTLPNLERLTINDCYVGNYFEAVAYFLQHSPNLEYLTLHQMTGLAEFCIGVSSQSARDFSFDCPRLKIIEIRCSKRNESVMEFVKTLQANANDLLKINIFL